MPPKRRRIEEPAAAQGGNEANPIPHNDFVPLELNRQDNDNQVGHLHGDFSFDS